LQAPSRDQRKTLGDLGWGDAILQLLAWMTHFSAAGKLSDFSINFHSQNSQLASEKITAQEPQLDTKCCGCLLSVVVGRTDQTTFQFYGLATAIVCPALTSCHPAPSCHMVFH